MGAGILGPHRDGPRLGREADKHKVDCDDDRETGPPYSPIWSERRRVSMILLLGASGYVGEAFASELRRRRCDYIPLTRKAIDYTQFHALFDYMRRTKPAFVINAAGFPGKPNVDTCEIARGETLYANTILPQTIARVCLMRSTPWGHVSSGGIYRGAKVVENGELLVERDLNQPELRGLLAEQPEKLRGFTELDEPNFSFLCPPCSFYSGSKAAAEQGIQGVGRCYVWRPGVPFNGQDHPRNFLSKIQRYRKVYDQVNSFSHLEDFVRACLDLWEGGAAFGTYNVTKSRRGYDSAGSAPDSAVPDARPQF